MAGRDTLANKKVGTINILIINAYRLQLHRKPDVKPNFIAKPSFSAPRQFEEHNREYSIQNV